ncbi:MAG: glycosyltransferase family 4 protein [Planctomycetes bacterium]|nr:glycosyltransferase family 4 protein [Planctomycetota bacterium]
MRVALVHMRHAHTGGTERYLNQTAAFLAERGDDVTIVCRSHEAPPHPAVQFEELRPIAIGATARMKTFAKAVEKHVKAARYDVVYGLGKTWTHDVIRLGGGCQATYLELAHEATLEPWERALRLKDGKHEAALEIEAKALAKGAYRRVVVNSKLVGDDVVRRHGVPKEKVALIYNGVDVERFTPALRATKGAELRQELGLPADERVVLFLGSGYGRKGLDIVLDAFAQVARAAKAAKAGTAHLLVVGYDSGAVRWEARAKELGLANVVRFLGGRRDTETCYAAADLYVLPTRYDPFANTTVEALASGLPVITTTTNGASELIVEGQCGSVLPRADDVPALARALATWLAPARLESGALAARKLAEQHSARSKCAQSAAVLDAVLKEKRAEPAGR